MRSAEYSMQHAGSAGIQPTDIEAASWSDIGAIKAWQTAHGLTADGWFGPRSVRAWLTEHARPAVEPIPIFGESTTIPGIAAVEYKPGRLAGRARKIGATVNAIVLHQSVSGDSNDNGHAIDELERILSSRGLGVDMAVDWDGSVVIYRDIGLDYSAHGNERNATSVGIEILNPYTRTELPYWTEMIDPSPTAWKGRECSDTPAQIRTLVALVRWLTSKTWEGPGHRRISIPMAFPTTPVNAPTRHSATWYDIDVGGVLAHGHRPPVTPQGKPVQAHSDARRTAWLLRCAMGI